MLVVRTVGVSIPSLRLIMIQSLAGRQRLGNEHSFQSDTATNPSIASQGHFRVKDPPDKECFCQGGRIVTKKYVLKLTAAERVELEQVVKKGKAAAWKIQRAQALLQCDQGQHGPGWIDEQVAQAYGCTTRSLESWRKQAVEEGPLSLLERKPRTTRVPKLDGEKEARLVTLACSRAPKGRARWTLRLLAERLVELEIVDAISHETVRRAMKKTS